MKFAAVVERLQTLRNPYPGLRPFDVSESHLFFGRDQQVAELVRRLERHRFVAVLGVSGSGKSSLVSAGLLPALERGGVWEAGTRWRQVITRPAGVPFDALRTDLERAGLDTTLLRESSYGLIEVARQLPADQSLLLVIDQFEELFRYKDLEPITPEARRIRDRQASDAAEFVQLLLATSRHYPPIYVVLTMRSDYLGDCAEFRDFPELLNDCQYLIPRLTRQQRKDAIEGPLGRVKIAPALVQRLLNDAGDEPDQLPVLQHALMRTWNQWRRSDPGETRPIGLADYEAVGGFEGALNRHADELLAQGDGDIAECLFKRLTARGRGNRERRDPATLAELWAVCGAVTPARKQQVTDVIDRFRQGDATFLRPLAGRIEPGTYVDITHESLIRQWKKLRDEWLPEEQLSAKGLLEIAERARNRKGGSGELVAGLDLVRVEAWDRARNKTAAWAEHYVDAQTLNDAFQFVQASRATERRRVLRRRAVWSTIVVVAVAALGLPVYNEIRTQQQEALAIEDQARTADDRRAQAEQELKMAEQAAAQAAHNAAAPTAAPPPPSPSTSPSTSPSVVEQRPLIYIQVRSRAELGRARMLSELLTQSGFYVPDAQVVNTGPSANEVRYFRNDERATAQKIVDVLATPDRGVPNVRASYVAGFEQSDRVRRNQFELWLTPANVLPALVQQLNDTPENVRKAAGALLARDHRANGEAISLVLDMLSAEKLGSLTVQGRINALYFLNRSDADAWTDDQKRLAREAVARIRATGRTGRQANDELKKLQDLVGPAS